jgi:valyl-tRNA synthetase
VELAKPVLNGEDIAEERKAEVRRVLLTVMETSLRLLHPLMPFLTEEIWQQLASMIGKGGDTIMLAQYPQADLSKINEQAESDMIWLQGLIGAVRNIRGEMGLGNARLLPLLIKNISDKEREQFDRIEPLFKALSKVDSISFLTADQEPPLSSSSVVGQASVFVPMKGLIDPQAEIGRLAKKIEKLQKQFDVLNGKLSNQGFLAKAPANVVEAEKAVLADLQDQLARLNAQKEQLAAL